jgi:hypothetical protein
VERTSGDASFRAPPSSPFPDRESHVGPQSDFEHVGAKQDGDASGYPTMFFVN